MTEITLYATAPTNIGAEGAAPIAMSYPTINVRGNA